MTEEPLPVKDKCGDEQSIKVGAFRKNALRIHDTFTIQSIGQTLMQAGSS